MLGPNRKASTRLPAIVQWHSTHTFEREKKVRTKQNRINRQVNKPCHLNKHKIKRRITKQLTYRHVEQCVRIELMLNRQTKLFS